MKQIGEFLKRQDAFGQPISINYRGEERYNTVWGAVLTLAQKIFILIVAVIGVIDLFAYKDPNITQFKIFDKRNDDTVINLAENHAMFLIGFFEMATIEDPTIPSFVKIDPQYGRIELSQVIEDLPDNPKYEQVSLDLFTRENFPNEFGTEALE